MLRGADVGARVRRPRIPRAMRLSASDVYSGAAKKIRRTGEALNGWRRNKRLYGESSRPSAPEWGVRVGRAGTGYVGPRRQKDDGPDDRTARAGVCRAGATRRTRA